MNMESNPGARKKKELLIVDDVKLFLQLTKTLFSQEEYIITTAVDGLQALDIARAKAPDLVVLDLMMPRIDGDEVCRLLRWEPATKDIPIIMVSSKSDVEARRRCLYAGCDDFIPKPVKLDSLNRAVEKHLFVKSRKFPRVDVDLPCILDNGFDQLFTSIHTLSAGGAYVETTVPPLPGSDHKLTFYLPREPEHVSLRALARWNRMMPGNRPPGSGFEFVGEGEEDQRRLGRWARAVSEQQFLPDQA